ncbi:MAG: aminotransferase class I/II-fold pyridoxal phosphate-dependent enzyme [archaeon]
MKIQERASNISYAIRDLAVPAREIEAQGHKVLKLNIGDPDVYDFDAPSFIADAAVRAIKGKKNFYSPSEGIPEVRDAIAKRECKYRKVNVTGDDILPTAGGSEAISFLLGSLTGNGGEVLMPNPVYPLYASKTKYYGGKPVLYKCIEEDAWQPDLDDIRKKISSRTNAVVLINPNNPTGAVYSRKIIKGIVDICAENNVPLISDEVYDLLTFDKEFVSAGSVAKDACVMLLGSLSKVYFAPGWRAGYITFLGAGTEELKDVCRRMSRLRLSINTPAEYAMKAAMLSDHKFLKAKLNKLRRRRDYSYKRICEIPGLSVSKPEGAMYTFPKIENNPYKTDKEWVLGLLRQKHVLVVHGSGFGGVDDGHFRTVFLPNMETLETAFERIEEFVKG